ncbi:hypothetical protein P5V15_001401 [Pogonomyrmex californicus]
MNLLSAPQRIGSPRGPTAQAKKEREKKKEKKKGSRNVKRTGEDRKDIPEREESCSRHDVTEDTNRFDDCNLTNVKLYLKSECYRYDMHLDFDKNRWSVLYETYARFCKGYYRHEYLEPSLIVTSFLHNDPFVIIDCSQQNESVKSATVDVRLEFETKENRTDESDYRVLSH